MARQREALVRQHVPATPFPKPQHTEHRTPVWYPEDMQAERWQLDGTALLAALRESQTQLNRDYHAHLELLSEVLARGLAATTGYAQPARLLVDLLRISRAEATRRIGHADAITPARRSPARHCHRRCRPPPTGCEPERSAPSASRPSAAP